MKIDVIVTGGGALLAVKRATSVIPIVFAVANDPVGAGYVSSLAQPGGVTGLTIQSLTSPANGSDFCKRSSPISAPRSLAMSASRHSEEDRSDCGIGGYSRSCGGELGIARARTRTVRLRRRAHHQQQCPYQYLRSRCALGPGLQRKDVPPSRGTNVLRAQYDRPVPTCGDQVDKILRGAKPSDIPVEQPTGLNSDQFSAAERRAKALGLEVISTKFEGRPYDFAAQFRRVTESGAQMLLILSSPFFGAHTETIVDLMIQYRLPTMFIFRRYVEAGGLMSYGPDNVAMLRQAAVYVAKVLPGASPADLPVEQPSKFEFAINLRTAKAIGIELPTSVLLRADEVIE
jgi:ABC-type uncharacterized transport system substrate-binding protein